MNGKIVLSLDFELRWGVYDVFGDDFDAYRKNIEGVRDAIPRLLELFESEGVRATWATVGAVACASWDEWHQRAPAPPEYRNSRLRWRRSYEEKDPKGRLHFAPDLVEAIASAKGQELASHTFSHVFFREAGFVRADAERDASAMRRLFQERWGMTPTSFVFPRNQVEFTGVLTANGITAWRENPRPRFWRSTTESEQSRRTRVLRLLDGLLPLGARRAAAREQRASHFIRLGLPHSLWKMHLARIGRDARKLSGGEALHLWWHPHNLGDAPALRVSRVAELLSVVREAAPGAEFASMKDIASASAAN